MTRESSFQLHGFRQGARGLAVLLLLVGVPAIACSSSSTSAVPVNACQVGGGLCVTTTDLAACATILTAACAPGFTCCSPPMDGAVLPVDAGVDASDAVDATPPDAGAPGDDAASVSDASDAGVDAPADASADAYLPADAHRSSG